MPSPARPERRCCHESRQYADPCAMLEAVVAITSGVLIWIGLWDSIEVLLPSSWHWRLLMIIVGLIGLFATRTLYDQEALHLVRRGQPRQRTGATLLPSNELMLGGCGTNEDEEAMSVPRSPVMPATPATPSAKQENPRRFFNAPPPDARRCCRALFALGVGLMVWVGIWDLVDYNVLPALTNSSCAAAEAHPGPLQLSRSPGCMAVKFTLVVVGSLGLWATRTLYGSADVAEVQFQPYR